MIIAVSANLASVSGRARMALLTTKNATDGFWRGDVASGNVAPPMGRRQHVRKSVLCHGELKPAGHRPVRCVVLDLSDRGAKVQVNKHVAAGQFVNVRFMRWTSEALVIWSRDNLLGLRFVESCEDLVSSTLK
jgi:hypothetical protein